MKRFLFAAGAVLAAALVVLPPAAASQVAESDDVVAVKAVIEAAYVKGIHVDRDVDAIRKGFHPAFAMFACKDGGVSTMSIDEWISNIEEGKKKTPDSKSPHPPKVETTHEFAMVNVAGNAAVARVELYKNGKHVFTDFMSLYKLEDGWKIVGKIYYRHP